MNRITAAIERAATALASVPAEGIAKCEKSATITPVEYRTYQDWRALAQANGILTHEESQTLYGILDSGPTAFAAHSLAARIVCLKSLSELAPRRAMAGAY